MSLRTPEQYKESLRDGREVYYRGEKVEDVTTHPVIGKAVQHACIDYQMAEDPRYRDLAVVTDPQTGQEYSRYYHLPQNAEDLLQRSRLIEASTREGATLVILIKEIGTDALLALHIVAEEMAKHGAGQYRERVKKYYELCRDNDYAVAVAQSDVKGDRSLGPQGQEHPDYYVRIVDRRDDGIVVRGAKIHTSVSTNTDEIIVLPTRAMREGDEDYAVAFAIPAATKGLKLLASSYGGFPRNDFEYPISAKHKMMETLTVFDDVFVPWERVFLAGEVAAAGLMALTFVKFHRFTAVSYKLPLLELMAGASQAIAEYNGIERAGHIREKLTKLASYHATVQGLILAAAQQHTVVPPGIADSQYADDQCGQISVCLQLPPGGPDGAGCERRPAGDRAEPGGLAQRGNRSLRPEISGRQERHLDRAPAAADEPDFRPDRGRLWRLSGSAGRPRRGLPRSRKAPDLSRV